MKLMKAIRLFCLFIMLSTSAGQAGEELYTNVLPDLLCEANKYFTSCFETSPQQCSKLMKGFAEQCLNSNQKFIEKIQAKKDSISKKQIAIRIKIGSCMGELYEKKQMHIKVDSKKCFSEKEWNYL